MALLSGSLVRSRRAAGSHAGRRLSFEPMEARTLLSVQPLTTADPDLFGDTPNAHSRRPAMSADGQIVVFQSDAQNIVPNDVNAASDIFVLNRSTGEVSLVSVNLAGTASANGGSINPRITPDGRYVVFESEAIDLTAETILTGGGHPDVFVRDLVTGVTTLVSKSLAGNTGGNAASTNPAITPDGRYVVFDSIATNLVATDTNGRRDVFRRDLQTGVTTLISRRNDGPDGGDGDSFDARMSADGRFVLFVSFAENLDNLPLADNNIEDIFVHDTVTLATELISIDSTETRPATSHTSLGAGRAMSDDGRYVIFQTGSDLTAADETPANEVTVAFGNHVYLRDRQLGTTTPISLNTAGNVAEESFSGVISPNGRYVAFLSSATAPLTGLADGNPNAVDVFLRDLGVDGDPKTGVTHLASVNVAGTASGNAGSGQGMYPFDFSPGVPALSDDGRYVGFVSEATDLVAGVADGNQSQTSQLQRRDVFVRDVVGGLTRLVSVNGPGTAGGDLGSNSPVLASNTVTGELLAVAFESSATNLVGRDNNQSQDVFVRNMPLAHTELASLRSPLLPESIMGSASNYLADVTPDGRYAAIVSNSANLTLDVPSSPFDTNVYVRDRLTGDMEMISVRPDGTARRGNYPVRLSADGRFVVFTSSANDLEAGATYTSGGVWLRDREAGLTRLISRNPATLQSPNGATGGEIAFSRDGRYIAFTSAATNLLSGLTFPAGITNLFLYDRVTGTLRLVNQNGAGTGPGNTGTTSFHTAFQPAFSDDGSKLIFVTNSSDLIAGVTDGNNGGDDAFAYDTATGQLELVSAAATPGATGNQGVGRPDISADGRYVVFSSSATNLTATPNSGFTQIYRRDLLNDVTQLVSLRQDGTAGANQTSRAPYLSADGQKVLFESFATNLTSLPTLNRWQAYVRDLSGSVTTLVSASADGTTGGNEDVELDETFPSNRSHPFSDDGRHVLFATRATNLVGGFVDGNAANARDLFLRDLQTGRTSLVTYSNTGTASANRGAASVNGGNIGSFLLAGLPGQNPVAVFDTPADDQFPGDRNFDGFYRSNNADTYAYLHEGDGQIAGTVSRAGLGIPYWTVYVDANGNNRFDDGERNVQTDAAGQYRFTGLPAGGYTLGLVLQNGFTQTAPANPDTYAVNLASATAVVENRDFSVALANVDLQVAAVTAPSTIAVGADLAVTWTVRNLGNAAAAGGWQDAVYLSTDAELDAGDTLLGTVAHTGGLGAGATYSANLTVSLPAVPLGPYQVLVQTDRRRQVPADDHRENNLASSGFTTTITVPTLGLGMPFADQFTGAGQEHYYQFSVAPGESLVLTLDSEATAGGTELYLRRFDLPTAYDFDLSARLPGQPDQALTVPVTQPGTYYVLARSLLGPAATSPFTITATVETLDLTSVSPGAGGNTGRVTVALRGAGLSHDMTAQLVLGGTTISAVAIDFRDASLAYATFDLTGQPVGLYDVQITDGTSTATLAGAFTVEPGIEADGLRVFVSPPELVRYNRLAVVLVEYVNTGNTDRAAPLLKLTANGALVKLPDQNEFTGNTVEFLGIGREGPAGVLRPGQRGKVRIQFIMPDPSVAEATFDVRSVAPETAMDWAAMKETIRPGHIPADAWDAVYANFIAEAGATTTSYEALLGRAASYLSQVGIYTPDPLRLLSYEIARADAVFAASSLARVTDSWQPGSGFDLVFAREHLQAIHGRYTVGPLGRGWAHNWDMQVTTLTGGDVIVRQGGARRFFELGADGVYRSPNNDRAVVTNTGGVYRITELDGSIVQFRADGWFEFVEDANGNRVTASYTGGLLTGLTHTGGPSITLHYNAQGRISQLTDSAGRTVTYNYDAAGEHLTSYTDLFGTHGYTYVTGQGAAREHALASIDYSDDTHLQFFYDAAGRLIHENRDGGAEGLNYGYLPGGGYTITNALGNTRTILHDDLGLPVLVTDSLGRTAEYAYDDERNLIEINLPLGVSYSYEYDAQGNLVRSVDPLGQAVGYSYDARGNLLSFTDARGYTTSYGYDAANNLLDITYPNDTVERFEYDTWGNLTQQANRRGQVLGYTYNAAGQVTRKEYEDGTHVDYVYNARGRLVSATDAHGTVALQYNANETLQRIDYPDGRWLEFTYNIVGQRTQSKDQDGFIVNYHYDDLGRLDRLTDAGGSLIVDYDYDAAGRLSRQSNNNGTATTYQYDAAGQLLRLTNLAPDGATVNSFFEYTYDALGRRSSVTTQEGTTLYGYDALGQLTSATLPGGRVIAYSYDAAGNRTSVTDNGVVTLYTANELNQYIRIGDATFTYDADGNRVGEFDGANWTNYAFDAENRLLGFSGTGGSAQFEYNALGYRSAAVRGGVRTEYLVDPYGLDNVVGEYGASGLLARYTHGFGLVSRIDATGVAAYYDFDGTHSTVGLTDSSGIYVNRYSYLPFGETTTLAAALPNPFTFAGQLGVMTEANGLYYMRARYYDAESGQFISEDPIGLNGQDLNLRRYVGNNPVSWTDPVGLRAYRYIGPSGAQIPPLTIQCTGNTIKDPKGGPDRPIWQGNDGQWYDVINGEFYGLRPDGQNPNIAPVDSGSDGGGGNGGGGDGGGWGGGDGGGGSDESPWPDVPPGDPGNADGGGGGGGCACGCPPGAPPATPPGGSLGGGRTGGRGSFDPNAIVGPGGIGTPRFITGEGILPYTIFFENAPALATAPAQEVFITHQLDADLDWTTFVLEDFGFGPLVVDVPEGVQSYTARIEYQNQDGSDLLVDVSAALDLETGIVSWIFRSLDPLTGELPDDVFAGFLPVNDATHRGEGFVSYTVRAKTGLATGTTIDQQAAIVFDVNAPILTNVHTNTIDARPDLGPIQYQALSGLPFVNGVYEARFQAFRDGLLTLLGEDAAQVQLELFDGEGQLLATAIPGTAARIDWAVTAGQQFIVRLTASPSATLRLANLVVHDAAARTLVVHGTAASDPFSFVPADGGQYIVTIHGIAYGQFNTTSVGSLSFLGAGGDDQATFTGTAEAETVVMRPGSLLSTSASLTLEAQSAERITFLADALDTLDLFDSPAIDRLNTTRTNTVTLRDLADTYTLTARRFGLARFHGSGQVGVRDNADPADDWGDFATLDDTAGKEVFHGYLGGVSTFVGPVFNYALDGFHTVRVTSSFHGPTDGADEAYFHMEAWRGTAVPEQFQSSAIARAATLGDETMTEEGDVRNDYNGQRVRTDDFVQVFVIGDLSQTDLDRAYLMGSRRIENFTGGITSSSMESRDADGALWFNVTATGVKAVYGAGKGGTSDLAQFLATPGVRDSYTQTRLYGRLAFPKLGEHDHITRGFRFDEYRITANDADDVARISDTPGADTLTADSTGLVLLETPFWRAFIEDFARVVATAEPDQQQDRVIRRGATDYLLLNGDWEDDLFEP